MQVEFVTQIYFAVYKIHPFVSNQQVRASVMW